jgi:hypothetical protein
MKHLFLLACSLLCISASAQTQNSAKTKAKLGTSFRFDPNSLHGRFQNSPNTTATVENDKFLEDLLGARKNFSDRIKQDKERKKGSI